MGFIESKGRRFGGDYEDIVSRNASSCWVDNHGTSGVSNPEDEEKGLYSRLTRLT